VKKKLQFFFEIMQHNKLNMMEKGAILYRNKEVLRINPVHR